MSDITPAPRIGRAAVRPAATDRRAARRVILGGAIGNVVEWYDFGVYAYLTPVIAILFFDPSDPATGLLATFSIFAVSFFTRPLGGAVLGHFGDKIGRKPTLVAAILIMSIATLGIGLLPTFASIGLVAPLLLLLLRMAQGFAAGGELVGAASFVVEYAPKNRRGLYGGLGGVGVLAGFVLGAIVVTVLTAALGTEAMSAWGWRIPFLLAAPIGLIGQYLRSKLSDTPVFRELESRQQVTRSPFLSALRTQWRSILTFLFVITGYIAAQGMFLTYFPAFLQTSGKLPAGEALLSNTVAIVVFAIVFPLAGALSDRWGRKRMIVIGLLCTVLVAVPVYALLAAGSFALALLGQLLMVVPLFFLGAPVYVALVEFFPAALRYSSGAISYNLAQAIFGGTTGIVSVWLIGVTSNSLAPGWYLAVLALVSVIVTLVAFRKASESRGIETGQAA